jgi:hypothetical protein
VLDLHAGFYQQLLDQLPQIGNILDKVKNAGSSAKISVSGHILGDTMSTILACHLKKNLFPEASPLLILLASSAIHVLGFW